MQQPAPSIIDSVRSLMPIRTLYILARPLTEVEARIVAERQVAKLLELLGVTKPSVEIELIAELPEIEVDVLPNLPLSGSSDWIRDHWQIHINADDSLWRCRSTLAHELKHILDDPFREELYPDWPRESTLPPPQRAEEICEYFAGCVLAPTAWLKNAWRTDIRDTAELASLFDVSEALIRVRLYQTGLATHRLRAYPRREYTRSAAALVRAARRRLMHERMKHHLIGAQSCV
jgi:Zn-dependent peptidase ImmA (M78 family)